MTATEFTPLASLVGGALIGLAAVLLMLLHGRIAGISGILGRLLPPYAGRSVGEDLALIAGLILAPVVYQAASAGVVTQTVSRNWLLMLAAGLLVGFGTALSRGCTSGHGVCGLARLSTRSLVATAVFMATAFATVYAVRHLLGG
ncbi:MAG TPA: YeeE/YedE family protein [Hyphomicrobiaceae bacterium]|nr:YeeE/YedE family protein [Hyphomicrobiaceae bacterium]